MSEPDIADRHARLAHHSRDDAHGGALPRRSVQLLAALFVLVVLWLVVRVTIPNALVQMKPELAASLAPKHPQATIRTIRNGSEAAGNPADPAALGRAIEQAPLEERPLLFAARQAIREENFSLAERLLDEVVHRNPRSRQGHLLRLERQIRGNQVEDATLTVAVLSRLLPDSGPLLVNELAKLSEIPSAQPAMLRIVRADSRMRTELLEALARQGADPDTIFELAGPVQPSAAGEVPRWQTLMLDGLVSRGNVGRAREVWSRISGVERSPALLYDPEFRGLPAPPPFNWHFPASPEGFAELSRGQQGLYAEYYGRRNAVLGGQLLTLSPGSYRLAFRAEGSADGEGGRLAWALSCQAGDRRLATVPITDVGGSSKAFSAAFTVTGDCPAQWLRLTGRYGEFPKDQRITIRELQLTRAGTS